MRIQNFQPVKYNKGRHSIGGVLAVAAVRGMIVCRSTSAEDTLALATGKAGFFLTRDVVANEAALKAYHDADELRPNKAGFQTPAVAGDVVQAEELHEVWVEGTDLLDASITNSTPAGSKLTTTAGKFALLTNSNTQECVGIIRTVLAAQNAVAPAKRFLIEILRNPVNLPAA